MKFTKMLVRRAMAPRNASGGLADITQQFDIKLVAEGIELATN